MPDATSKFILEASATVAELQKKFDALSDKDKKKVLAKVGEL
jgi:hypothetical protein